MNSRKKKMNSRRKKENEFPTAVYQALESDRGAALVLSVVLVLLALVVLVALRAKWWPWSVRSER